MNNPTAATAALSVANIEKPKRPLSAFNLFYRYKRQHIIRLLKSNAEGSVDKDTIRRLIKTPPGLEYNYTLIVASVASTQAEIDALRRHHICIELKNLQARDLKTRAHRKSMNCPIGFVELSKLMNSSWKDCDDVAKAVFNELSQEIREVYHRKIKEYNDMCKALGITKQKQMKNVSKKRKNLISIDESDGTSKEPDNKKAKPPPIHQPKFPPPLTALTSPPRVTPTPNNEVANKQEAANAMLMLGTAANKKKQNGHGPLKKRQVYTSSLLNINTGPRSISAFHHPPPSKSGVTVQLDDFTGQFPPPLRAMNLAQLNQSSQMTRMACAQNGDVFARSYNSSSLLQQYMLREMERIKGSGRR